MHTRMRRHISHLVGIVWTTVAVLHLGEPRAFARAADLLEATLRRVRAEYAHTHGQSGCCMGCTGPSPRTVTLQLRRANIQPCSISSERLLDMHAAGCPQPAQQPRTASVSLAGTPARTRAHDARPAALLKLSVSVQCMSAGARGNGRRWHGQASRQRNGAGVRGPLLDSDDGDPASRHVHACSSEHGPTPTLLVLDIDPFS